MSYLLRQIFELVRLLNSDTGTNSIAAGIACGLILGFAPVFSLQTVLVIAVLFLFRIQLGAALVSPSSLPLSPGYSIRCTTPWAWPCWNPRR